VDSMIQVEGWRKMEAAAQNRPEYGKEWSVMPMPTANDKA